LFLKRIFSDAAQRAYPIVGDVFPLCARRYAAVGIAFFRIVHVPAHGTFVFIHNYAPQIALYRIFADRSAVCLYYINIFEDRQIKSMLPSAGAAGSIKNNAVRRISAAGCVPTDCILSCKNKNYEVNSYPMNPTIYEVAKRAGVSTATVSHVFNNTRYVSDDLRSKVAMAVRELNYKPNVAARRLRGGASKSLGLIVPDCTNTFFAEIARAVDRVCFSLGYNIILCNTDNNAAQQSYYIDMLISKQVDGVIFISSNGAGGDIRKCETASVPAVIVDRDVHHGSADNIIVNNEKGGYDAASYLIGLGFTKIGCITGPEGISSSMQRMAGFKRALEENDIAFDEKFVYGGDFHYSGGRDAFLHLHLLSEMPQAVFACNDMMAIGFIHTAAAYGVRVPDDISVIGFDNTELSAVVSPTLTTIAQPIEEIAEIATERLLQKVENSSRDVKKIILEPHLIIRESCKRIF